MEINIDELSANDNMPESQQSTIAGSGKLVSTSKTLQKKHEFISRLVSFFSWLFQEDSISRRPT